MSARAAERTTAAHLVDHGVATLHEAAGRRGLASGIRLLVGPGFAGRASTVSLPAGDNLGIHALLGRVPPGGVACIASAGQGRFGVLGELIAEAARARGVAGIVIDDGIRDAELLTAPPSIAARGVVATGTVKRRHLGLDGPVALAGLLVRRGDWLVADQDGVCIVPAARLDAVLVAADARRHKENVIREAIRAGESTVTLLDLGGLLKERDGGPR